MLHFAGVRGAGDEVYDLVGLEGLLGVRPGPRDGEVLAFLERSAHAAAAFRRLTGLAPVAGPMPVRSAGAGHVRVTLEQTLARPSGAPTPAAVAGAGASSAGPAGRGASATAGPKGSSEHAQEPVPDSWEETLC